MQKQAQKKEVQLGNLKYLDAMQLDVQLAGFSFPWH